MPRAVAVQTILLLALAGFVVFLATNLVGNIARLNLHVGFNFLARPAGFEIAQTPIAYPEGATYFRAFLVALINTILIAVVSILLSTVLGFIVALARLSTNPLLALLAQFYIETIRNVPLLLQLFFWYFAVLGPLPLPRQSLTAFGLVFLNKRGLSVPTPVAEPSFPVFITCTALFLTVAIVFFTSARRYRVKTGQTSRNRWVAGFVFLCAPGLMTIVAGTPVTWDVPRLNGFNLSGGTTIIPEFVAMAIGMSVYGSAFIAELIRGGFASVSHGQTEAGLALGLSRSKIYSKIVIPQALRTIVPPLAGQYITLLKNSSLASAIGYPDLMLIFAGTALNQTGQPLEVMAMTMASYLLLCLITAGIGNVINRRMQLVER
ncbi:amino acid ABC transporter permease [Microvirga alba]|uniref:amino acid ABC transporter permease n=1 Tax=Microvirga alba TaxID=2791025 RepID=UPI002D21DFC7|nr:ABC transporter permease subunit [Microvirga alba]